MLSVFSNAFWPSLCLFWRKAHLNLVPLFDWVVSLILRCISCLYVLERNSSWVSLLHIVSLWGLSFCCVYGFLCCSSRRRQWHPTPVLLPGNPMDGGAWKAAVHGVAQSRTGLSNFTFTFHFLDGILHFIINVMTQFIPATAKSL